MRYSFSKREIIVRYNNAPFCNLVALCFQYKVSTAKTVGGNAALGINIGEMRIYEKNGVSRIKVTVMSGANAPISHRVDLGAFSI
jgi:hypothetical protein